MTKTIKYATYHVNICTVDHLSDIKSNTFQKFIGVNPIIQETFDIAKMVIRGTGSIEQMIEPMSSKCNEFVFYIPLLQKCGKVRGNPCFLATITCKNLCLQFSLKGTPTLCAFKGIRIFPITYIFFKNL